MATTSMLREALAPHVDSGSVPGAVALVCQDDDEQVLVLGKQATDGAAMTRDSIFRVASITKPITALATLMLVERGVLGLDDPVEAFLPELAAPQVLRAWDGPVQDTVPADRPISTRHLLTFTAGHGFPADFSAPVVELLFHTLGQGPPSPQGPPGPDAWMRLLAGIPLLHQPGEGWTYNTGSDVLGVLVARACGQSLPDFLAEHVFGPLGMRDTGFYVPAADLCRLVGYYRPDGNAGLTTVDQAAGQWSSAPAFPSGAGGLVSTVDDWLAFGRLLLAGGTYRGTRLLGEQSVRLMMTDHLTPALREAGRVFLDGQGWGYGGSVDVGGPEPWIVPGRYGWIGGTGTSAHVDPGTGRITLLMTQVELTGLAAPSVMRDFWTAAARA
jgi:CubicO group peptidase (beta-lactamase class C family)